MSMNQGRTKAFERNAVLEGLLEELNEQLAEVEDRTVEGRADTDLPQVMIIGAPRSGTTLMLQWLAATGSFSYPTNLLSRFYRAPSIGAKIQEILTNPKLAHGDELEGLGTRSAFTSDLGKTRGPLAPHEFWYFWRRFLPTEEIEPMGARAEDADWKGLRGALASVSAVFGRPLAMKGMMMQYDLGRAARELPRALFLHVHRDPLSNSLSLLRARESFFGDRARWYSAKPPEHGSLVDSAPPVQVAGQVHWTNVHIERGLREVPEDRQISVSYEAFCADTSLVWERLREQLGHLGHGLATEHDAPASFSSTNSRPQDASDAEAITSALNEFALNTPSQ